MFVVLEAADGGSIVIVNVVFAHHMPVSILPLRRTLIATVLVPFPSIPKEYAWIRLVYTRPLHPHPCTARSRCSNTQSRTGTGTKQT